jgi:hypothetical protein
MRKRNYFFTLFPVALATAVFACTLVIQAQDDDSPSLGEVARQARQQRQQAQTNDSQSIADQSTASQTANSKNASAKDAASGVSPVSQATQGKDSKNAAQNKGSQNPDAATAPQPLKAAKHVITNDEIPSRGGPSGYRPTAGSSSSNESSGDLSTQPADSGKMPASDWTSHIQAQKDTVANLQGQIQQLSDSIQYAGANCVSGCAEWNEHQKQKQDQVESMKVQLEQAQQQQEQMQEQCRQQGYGGSVCEP